MSECPPKSAVFVAEFLNGACVLVPAARSIAIVEPLGCLTYNAYTVLAKTKKQDSSFSGECHPHWGIVRLCLAPSSTSRISNLSGPLGWISGVTPVFRSNQVRSPPCSPPPPLPDPAPIAPWNLSRADFFQPPFFHKMVIFVFAVPAVVKEFLCISLFLWLFTLSWKIRWRCC